MSTVEKVKGVVFFEFNGEMITKKDKGWITLQGVKFDGRDVANFVRSTSLVNMQLVIQLKSILNRYFGYSHSFKLS